MSFKIRRSAVPGKAPTTQELELGEIAVNTADGRLFVKKNRDGLESIVEVGLRPGIPGDKGDKGDSIVGPQGPQGEVGPVGPQGESIVGPKGDKGDTGDQGIQGLSAYQVAIANGFTGTEQEWLDHVTPYTQVQALFNEITLIADRINGV